MPSNKFRVTVRITKSYDKALTVHARDEADAEQRACEIVSRWDGVDDAVALEAEPL